MISSCQQWVDKYGYWSADQPALVFIYFYLRQNIILLVRSSAGCSPSTAFSKSIGSIRTSPDYIPATLLTFLCLPIILSGIQT